MGSPRPRRSVFDCGGTGVHGHRRARNRGADATRARTAWEDGTLSCDLGRAAERASATSRRVATETGLAGAGRSVVAVGLDMAAAHLGPWVDTRVLIVGTGAYAGATVSALHALGASDVSVYSTSGRAREFAEGRGIGWVDAADLPSALKRADLVVTCRGLGSPVLTRDMAAQAEHTVVLDLALMRDTESSVASLPTSRSSTCRPSRRRSPPPMLTR